MNCLDNIVPGLTVQERLCVCPNNMHAEGAPISRSLRRTPPPPLSTGDEPGERGKARPRNVKP